MTQAIATVSKHNLKAESDDWAARAKGLQVVDKQSYVNAGNLLTSVKHFRAEIAKFFAPHVEAAMKTKREAEAARKGLVEEQTRMEAPLVSAEGTLKKSLLAWDAKQEERRAEEERRLQAEAQKMVEEKTLAYAAELEEEATATGNAYLLQEAHSIMEQPIDTPAVVVKTSMPKVQGVSYRDHWKASEHVDIKVLAAAVAAGSVPTSFLTPNMSALNNFARATEGNQPIPGVKIWNDRQVVARATA